MPLTIIAALAVALLALAGLAIVVVYYPAAWMAVGVDPQRGLVIPLYEPPPGLSPAAARYLMEMGYDNRCLSAALVSMAVKGHLTVSESDGAYTLTWHGPPGQIILSAATLLCAGLLMPHGREPFFAYLFMLAWLTGWTIGAAAAA